GAARAAARAHARCEAPARPSPPQTRWQRCPAADLRKVATRTAGGAPTAPRIRSASAAPPQATSTPQTRPPRPLRASRPMTTGRGRHRAAKNLPPYWTTPRGERFPKIRNPWAIRGPQVRARLDLGDDRSQLSGDLARRRGIRGLHHHAEELLGAGRAQQH